MIKFAEHNQGSISRWETPQLAEEDRVEEELPEVEDLDELRQKAFDQGFNEGYKNGIDQAEEEVRGKFEDLQRIMNAINRPLADLDQEILEYVAQLAGKIARQLVKRELRTEPETIMALVRDSVSILNGTSEKIRIHLHPTDAQVIYRLTEAATEKNRWEIVEDPLVAHGDCRVGSLDSIVSGDIQNRINSIIMQCLGDERSADN